MKKLTIVCAAALTALLAPAAEVIHENYFSEDFRDMGFHGDFLSDEWVTYGIDALPATYSDENYNLRLYYQPGGEGTKVYNYILLNANEQTYPVSCTNFTPTDPSDPQSAPTADQWMVSPAFEVKNDNCVLMFSNVVYTTQVWGGNSCPVEVRVSTTGTAKEDFTDVIYSGTIKAQSNKYGQIYSRNLAARLNGYNGKMVHLAFINKGKEGGNVGFTNMSVSNYGFNIQDNTPRTAVKGEKVIFEFNVGLKAPVDCSSVKVVLEYGDQKLEQTLTKAFGSSSNSIVYTMCTFDSDPLIIGDEAVPYTVTVTPDFPGATSSVLTGTITVPNQYWPNNVVIEEGTATGCGWCPRGIAALEYYSHTYPGTETQGMAIPIGVHGNMNYQDPMNRGVESYISGLYALNGGSGLPQAMFNRATRGKDPADLAAFEKEIKKTTIYKADITGVRSPANMTWGDNVTVDFAVRSGFTATNVPMLVAAILTEDNVKGAESGYTQENYLAKYDEAYTTTVGWGFMNEYLAKFLKGGEFGMENISFNKITYQHVARGIWPEFKGQSFGNDWVSGEPVSGSLTFQIPTNVLGTVAGSFTELNKDNLKIVVVVLDPLQNYQIVASDIKPFTYTSGVNDVAAEINANVSRLGNELTFKADYAKVEVYSVDGMKQADVQVNGVSTYTFANGGVAIVRITTDAGTKVVKL